MTNTGQPSSLPSAARPWRRLGVVLLLAAAALVWLLSGFYTVGTDELGVVTRFGRLCGERTRAAGLHYTLPWPIDRVYTPRTTEVRLIEVGFTTLGQKSSERRRSDVLTGDENILKIMMVVQYKISDAVGYLFNAEDPHWLVERTVESVMNRQVASLKVDDVLTTAKGAIQVEAIASAQELLDAYGAGIVLLGGNLQAVDPPVPVMEAFKEVASAKKDRDRLIDEAHEYCSRVLPDRSGQGRCGSLLESAGRIPPGQGHHSHAPVRRDHGARLLEDGRGDPRSHGGGRRFQDHDCGTAVGRSRPIADDAPARPMGAAVESEYHPPRRTESLFDTEKNTDETWPTISCKSPTNSVGGSRQRSGMQTRRNSSNVLRSTECSLPWCCF